MGSPLEKCTDEFEAPAEIGTQEGDLVFAALQGHLGEGARLHNYTAMWRKDYEGDASAKRYVGGALLVKYTAFAEDRISPVELVVTPDMFPPDVKEELETQARANWSRNIGWIRDYGRNRS